MARTQTSGKCALCGKSFKKASMGRHLLGCRKAHPATVKSPIEAKAYLIQVEGRYQPAYWLFVEMPSDATFGHLDAFLREAWLECCGHMSAFDLTKKSKGASNHSWLDALEDDEQSLMDERMDDFVKVGDQFTYDYDFGSTTSLALKIVGEYESVFSRKGDVVRLLCHNDPPEFKCDCGESATLISTEVDEFYCEECFNKTDLDESCTLTVVNSPRMGVCGYTGGILDQPSE